MAYEEVGGCRLRAGFSMENVRFLKPGDRVTHETGYVKRFAGIKGRFAAFCSFVCVRVHLPRNGIDGFWVLFMGEVETPGRVCTIYAVVSLMLRHVSQTLNLCRGGKTNGTSKPENQN